MGVATEFHKNGAAKQKLMGMPNCVDGGGHKVQGRPNSRTLTKSLFNRNRVTV